MSGLISSLVNGSQALTAHSKGVELAGRNLANVNNPGYARQRVQLGDLGMINGKLGPESMGTQAMGVQSLRDQLLDRQVTRELSQSALLQVRYEQLIKAQAQLGENIDRSGDSAFIGSAGTASTGISAGLDSFFNAFDNLAARPSDAAAKQLVLQNAATLAGQLNSVDARLATLQTDIADEATTATASANSLIQDIADLNKDIQRLEIQRPGSAIDLRDQRQAKVEELSRFLDVSTRQLPNGGLQVIARDTSAAEVLLVDGVRTAPLAFDGTQLFAGSPGATLVLQGGSIKGLVDVRDTEIQQLRDNLATAATQLATAVNTAYNPGTTTGNFFQVPPTAGQLLTLEPGLAISTLKTTDTGNAGANELALAVADVSRKTFSTTGGDLIDGTIGGFHSRAVSNFGHQTAATASRLEDQLTVEQLVRTQRDAVSAVSIDEELADLMKYQRAFEASARVINVLDELLDEVVNRLGR